jgi:WhiB family transcriptional regulator, redox-sensing transcriptional regulator
VTTTHHRHGGLALAEPVARNASLPEGLSEPAEVIGRRAPMDLPCHLHDPDLWFAESPDTLEHAKALCRTCPVRTRCLTGALRRHEPWGVWGGQILSNGEIVARKRPRGRPPKRPLSPRWNDPIPESA